MTFAPFARTWSHRPGTNSSPTKLRWNTVTWEITLATQKQITVRFDCLRCGPKEFSLSVCSILGEIFSVRFYAMHRYLFCRRNLKRFSKDLVSWSRSSWSPASASNLPTSSCRSSSKRWPQKWIRTRSAQSQVNESLSWEISRTFF